MENESILESRKYYQRNKMLNVIRTNTDVSRNDIRKITGYSMTTVMNTVEDMIRDGLIYEEECEEARVGRKPVWLRLNSRGGYFVGVEWNRTWMHCVVLDFTGKPVHRQRKAIDDAHRCTDGLLGLIKGMIWEAIRVPEGGKEKIIGIGLGVPGYSDKVKGIALSYTYFEGWDNIPVRQIVEEEFQIPCYMGNNVDVMIYAYKWLVFQGSCDDMLFVSVRTGARVMPVINNQAVSSRYGFPGELGHIRVGTGSRVCSCGRYGCLNSEVSDVAIMGKIRDGVLSGRFKWIADRLRGDTEKITMAVFREAVLAGDEDSLGLLQQTCQYLGKALGILVNIFAPSRIVMYGELASIGTPFLERLRKCVERDAIPENTDILNIEVSEFGPDLGAMGAAALVLQEAFEFLEETI